jgi:NAD(P)-dependent dehydrogenase (short-subunit alcohol dehydrogenase family)
MDGLRDKIVLVTGGSGGIGAALARAFAAQGSRVVIAARDAARLATVAERITQDGGQVRAIAGDVADRAQVQNLGAEISRHWGAVDILINNAGIARAVSFLDMADAEWEQIVAVNLTGAYHCCKEFLPAMIQAKWGRIINIASTTAKVGYSHVTAYTASKHGLLGLTRALALEVARSGVTVNAICPGYVDDERTRDNARSMAQKTGKSEQAIVDLFAASAPQRRLIAPSEVAELALLIASPQMSGMTGQAVSVDGGAVMT